MLTYHYNNRIFYTLIEEKAIDRVLKVIDALGISARQFDMSIGTTNGYCLRMHKNHASIGSDIIERISRKYPKVNLVWLITGKGDMFLEPKDQPHFSDAQIDAMIHEKVNEKIEIERQKLLDQVNAEIVKIKNELSGNKT